MMSFIFGSFSCADNSDYIFFFMRNVDNKKQFFVVAVANQDLAIVHPLNGLGQKQFWLSHQETRLRPLQKRPYAFLDFGRPYG